MEEQEIRSKNKVTSKNRRNSILKDVELEKENVTTKTTTKGRRSLKRVSFADTTSIKEFLASRDPNYTEWHDTYEEPVVNCSSSIEMQQSLQAKNIFEEEVAVETKDQKEVLMNTSTLDAGAKRKSDDFGFFFDHMSKFLGNEAAPPDPGNTSSDSMNFTCNVTGKMNHREELTSTTMDITTMNFVSSDMNITRTVLGVTDECKDLSSTHMEFTCNAKGVEDKPEIQLMNEKNASLNSHSIQRDTTCLNKSNVNMSLSQPVGKCVGGSEDSFNCDMSITSVIPGIVNGRKTLTQSSFSRDGNSSSNSDLNLSVQSADDSVFENIPFLPSESCHTKISNEDMEMTCNINMDNLLSSTLQPSAQNIDFEGKILENFLSKAIIPDTSNHIPALDKSLHLGGIDVDSDPLDVLVNKTERIITMQSVQEDCSKELNPLAFLSRSGAPDRGNCSAMISRSEVESVSLNCIQTTKAVNSFHVLQTSVASKTAKIIESENNSVLKDSKENSPRTSSCFNIEALNPYENVAVPLKEVSSKCLASNLSTFDVKPESEENIKSSSNENYDCEKILSPMDPSGLAAFEQENFVAVTDQEPGLLENENRIDSLLTSPITNRENHDISISLICEDVPYAVSKSALEKSSRIEILNADLQMNKGDLSIKKNLEKDASILPNTSSVFSSELKANCIEGKLALTASENVSLLKSNLDLDDNSKVNIIESGSLCDRDLEDSHKSFTNPRKRPSGDSLPCEHSAKMMHLETRITHPASLESKVPKESHLNCSNTTNSLENVGNDSPKLESSDELINEMSFDLVEDLTETSCTSDVVSPKENEVAGQSIDTLKSAVSRVIQDSENLALTDLKFLSLDSFIKESPSMNIDATEELLSDDRDEEVQSVIETNEAISEEENVEEDDISIHMEDDLSQGQNKLPCVQTVSENVELKSLENLEKNNETQDNSFCIACQRLMEKDTKIYFFIVVSAFNGRIQLGLPGRPFKLYLDIIIHNNHNVIGRADWGPKDKDLKTPIAKFAYKTFGHCVDAKMDSVAGLDLCKISDVLHEVVFSYETMMSYLRELFLIQSFFIANFDDEGLLKVILSNARAHLCISLRIALPSSSISTEDLSLSIEPKVEIGNLRTETLETALSSVDKGPRQLLRTIRCIDHIIQNMS